MMKPLRFALGLVAWACSVSGRVSDHTSFNVPEAQEELREQRIAATAASKAIDVQIDAEEADAVLAIIAGHPVWDRLFQTDAYKRLKQREAGGKYSITDADFREFVVSDELQRRASVLSRALTEWKKADLAGAGSRILPYLPEGVRIRAKVYIVIKPRENSFVSDLLRNPAVFLFLDPKLSKAQFENTVAHELHHVGLATLAKEMEQAISGLPPNARRAAERTGTFGEGLAMLAAAGSSDIHPHANSPGDVRARWDTDVANFEQDLMRLDAFFLEIIDGKLTEAEEREKAASFFGVQGPWYTVGWKMAVTVEKTSGRTVLVDCMKDMRRLLVRYNEAAERQHLPRWSPRLIEALRSQ
jgi:hypothetical protein